jgi:hypothetical protein
MGKSFRFNKRDASYYEDGERYTSYDRKSQAAFERMKQEKRDKKRKDKYSAIEEE